MRELIARPIDPAFVAFAERRQQLREDVVCGMARGQTLREIAAELGITYGQAFGIWTLACNPVSPFTSRSVT